MGIRELTKSMIRFSWAMSLFPLKQFANSVSPEKATEAFDAVTRATEQQFGNILKPTFTTGDKLQEGMVDLGFSFLTLDILNPSRMLKMTSDIMQSSVEAVRQVVPGGGAGTSSSSTSQSASPSSSASSSSSSQTPTGWGPVPYPPSS